MPRGIEQIDKVHLRTRRFLSAPTVADAKLPATVPASLGALFAAGLLPEHEFPTSGTQHNRKLVFRRRTVGEPEITVPATPLVFAAAGMAVDHVLDALEEDLESTVVASSRVELALNNVVQEESATMPVEVRFGASNDRVGVPVVQMAGTDSDILSDTVTWYVRMVTASRPNEKTTVPQSTKKCQTQRGMRTL